MGSEDHTCRRTRSVLSVFRNSISLHPSDNLLGFPHVTTTHCEGEACFVRLNQPPLLSLSHNSFHLVRFDILV